MTAKLRRRIPNRTRYLVMRRDGYACRVCGRTALTGALLEVDHKLAIAKGGTNDPENLWVLCALCNNGKGTHDL